MSNIATAGALNVTAGIAKNDLHGILEPPRSFKRIAEERFAAPSSCPCRDCSVPTKRSLGATLKHASSQTSTCPPVRSNGPEFSCNTRMSSRAKRQMLDGRREAGWIRRTCAASCIDIVGRRGLLISDLQLKRHTVRPVIREVSDQPSTEFDVRIH